MFAKQTDNEVNDHSRGPWHVDQRQARFGNTLYQKKLTQLSIRSTITFLKC